MCYSRTADRKGLNMALSKDELAILTEIQTNVALLLAARPQAAAPTEPFFGAMTKPEDLLTLYPGNPILPPTRDVSVALQRARYGYTHVGPRAMSADKMATEVYPYLNAIEVRVASGSVPDDLKLPNGDAMRPETFAFALATGFALLPHDRALAFGAGPKPTDMGPVTVAEYLQDQWSAVVPTDPSGR